jgi:nicotinamidase-related amidase
VNPGAKALQSILPLPHERGEPIVVKHRISPFIGTGLETLLRANGIDTLVLAGVHTSGVVLSTVRLAAIWIPLGRRPRLLRRPRSRGACSAVKETACGLHKCK